MNPDILGEPDLRLLLLLDEQRGQEVLALDRKSRRQLCRQPDGLRQRHRRRAARLPGQLFLGKNFVGRSPIKKLVSFDQTLMDGGKRACRDLNRGHVDCGRETNPLPKFFYLMSKKSF